MSEPLMKEDYEEIAEIRYRIRQFLRFSETAALDAGITPQQHQLLLAIQGFPSRDYATPTEIAERLQIKHHSCLGLIQRMEHVKLLERSVHPDDRRSVYIRLTEQGLKILRQLTEMHRYELNRLGFDRQPTSGHERPARV